MEAYCLGRKLVCSFYCQVWGLNLQSFTQQCCALHPLAAVDDSDDHLENNPLNDRDFRTTS